MSPSLLVRGMYKKGVSTVSVLTEYALRSKLRGENITELVVDKGTIITPSAKQYLQDKNIKLVVKDYKAPENNNQNIQREEEKKFLPKYEGVQGGFYESKPEYMTQLYGNKLVLKDHKRIVFRGKIDSLEGKILQTQVLAKNLGNKKVLSELEEVLKVLRNIAKAEILNENLGEFSILGMSEEELRETSHNPKKYLNVDHLFYPSYEIGEMAVALNILRSEVREVEVAAVKAFKNEENEVTRLDILQYLNRLSSCFYVMMLKCIAAKGK